ncbi:MAG TPA: 50S ribosomal protein L11 [Candidatus Thermoplasmatota archaeon]|nr:50S ribosomal protein L11 [Candidatus Thermoplasmatota archaeon]
MANSVEVLVDGGSASAGPPLGPALGPLGVNVMNVVKMINEKTADFKGMKVPVKVVVDPKTKAFDVTVGTPPTTQLILKEIGAEKGSGTPKATKVGDLSIESAMKVARMKSDDLSGANMKNKVKEVLGCCVSMGVTVDGGKDARDVQKAISAGEYDSIIK